MKASIPSEILGNTDIYLLDQIIKGRYQPNETILDAGCGSGRNMFWFYHNEFKLLAIDTEQEKIDLVKSLYPNQSDNFQVASLANLPYQDNSIDHIINCAVLHFSESIKVFKLYFSELVRVLKPNGSLFIRMASDIGVEKDITHIKDGVYRLTDETDRFLLSRKLLKEIVEEYPIVLIEPLKTTNVADQRAMSTIVLAKL